MKKKIIVTVIAIFILAAVGVFMFPKVVTRIYINRTELKDNHNYLEFANDETGRRLVMIGVSHVAKPEFYENVRKVVDSLGKEGYVFFLEGIYYPHGMDSLSRDTLARKLRKVLGFHISGGYQDRNNKSQAYYNPRKYIVQSDELLGVDISDPRFIHVDMSIPELINRYESDRGEITLTEYDWNTPLMGKYRSRRSRDTARHSRYYIARTIRDAYVAEMILRSEYPRIAVVYGQAHVFKIPITLSLRDSLGMIKIKSREHTVHTVKNPHKLYGKKMMLPQKGEWYMMKSKTNFHLSDKAKIIVWYDSVGCTSCRLKELYGWKNLLKDADVFETGKTDLIVIINPGNNIEAVQNNIARINFPLPVLYDIAGEFKSNNILPENTLHHTFLLDADGKTVLTGTPIYNPKLWQTYKKKIADMLDP